MTPPAGSPPVWMPISLDEYAAPLTAFVDDLTNWYIRRSRRRFWHEGMDEAKAQAYRTLYEKEGRAIASAWGMVVALDTTLTDDLRAEGLARELVRVIQEMRVSSR